MFGNAELDFGPTKKSKSAEARDSSIAFLNKKMAKSGYFSAIIFPKTAGFDPESFRESGFFYRLDKTSEVNSKVTS